MRDEGTKPRLTRIGRGFVHEAAGRLEDEDEDDEDHQDENQPGEEEEEEEEEGEKDDPSPEGVDRSSLEEDGWASFGLLRKGRMT